MLLLEACRRTVFSCPFFTSLGSSVMDLFAHICLSAVSILWGDLHQLFFCVTWDERRTILIHVVVWISEFGVGFINQGIFPDLRL